jgi:hypothetical protein
MNTDTGFTFQTAMSEITREVIETVADRPGDSPARRVARHQMTAWSILSFLPRDPVETMLAGQCVIFDHLLRDGVRDTLRGQHQDIKLRTRPQHVASAKMFLANLDKFEHMQTRLAAKLAGQPVEENATVSGAAPASVPKAPLAAAASAEEGRHAAQTEPAKRAPVAAPTEAPGEAPGEAQAGGAAAGAPAVEASPRAHQDQVHPTTPVAAATVSHTTVAQTGAQTADLSSTGAAGTVRTPPDAIPPDAASGQPKPGTQVPSATEPERALSLPRRNQTTGADRPADPLAIPPGTSAVPTSPVAGGRTAQTGQPPLSPHVARVKELV